MKLGELIYKVVLMSFIFLCEPDCAVFNLQGDKGEAGAAGRDVSSTKSPLHYSLLLFCPLLVSTLYPV